PAPAQPAAAPKPSSGPFIIVFSTDEDAPGSQDEINKAPKDLERDGRAYRIYYTNTKEPNSHGDTYWYAATLGPYPGRADAELDQATLNARLKNFENREPRIVSIEDLADWCSDMIPASNAASGYDTCPNP